MQNAIKLLEAGITGALQSFIKVLRFTISSDDDVISAEAKKILGNPEDKAEFMKALEKLKTETEVTFTLPSNHEELTLVR